MFRRVELAARRRWTTWASWTPRRPASDAATPWQDAIEDVLRRARRAAAPARTPAARSCCRSSEQAGRWLVRQVLDDPAGDHDWGITAEVDLAASDEAGEAVVRTTAFEPL